MQTNILFFPKNKTATQLDNQHQIRITVGFIHRYKKKHKPALARFSGCLIAYSFHTTSLCINTLHMPVCVTCLQTSFAEWSRWSLYIDPKTTPKAYFIPFWVFCMSCKALCKLCIALCKLCIALCKTCMDKYISCLLQRQSCKALYKLCKEVYQTCIALCKLCILVYKTYIAIFLRT